MLENAVGLLLRLGEYATGNPRVAQGDDLARLDLTHQRRPDRIQRHRLARDARIPVLRAPQHQRPPAPRVAHRFNPVLE